MAKLLVCTSALIGPVTCTVSRDSSQLIDIHELLVLQGRLCLDL